jgi:alpha-L-fucosidase
MPDSRTGIRGRAIARSVALLMALYLGSAVPAAPPAAADEAKAAAKIDNSAAALAPELKLSPADMAWWRDAKLGMFVHWGLYAIPAKGEWYMFNAHVPAAEYRKLADQFNPRHFDPDAWARAARSAGARYMVVTTRHHDGFALFDSPASYDHFDAMHSAAHTDFIRGYVDAARRQKLRVGLYYSPLDWRFPAYFDVKGLPENAAAFRKQTYDQIGELTSRYGKIDILWYDGGWLAHKGTDADAAWFWHPEILNAMVRRNQPKVVINPRSGWQGDFNTEEGSAPITGPIRAKPWEKTFSLTMSGAWGYMPDQRLMPLDQLKILFVNAVTRNGNMLVNVGPDADGVIPEGQVRLLQAFGQWTGRYGESLFATRPGPFQPVDGVYGTTHRGSSIYVHVLRWPDATLELPPLGQKVLRATSLTGGAVELRQTPSGIGLRALRPDPVDTIIRLDLDGPVVTSTD